MCLGHLLCRDGFYLRNQIEQKRTREILERVPNIEENTFATPAVHVRQKDLRTGSTETDCKRRGGTVPLASSLRYRAAADSDLPMPASGPHTGL